jgi:hypothetical protein
MFVSNNEKIRFSQSIIDRAHLPQSYASAAGSDETSSGALGWSNIQWFRRYHC